MEYGKDPRRRGSCMKFLSDFRSLFIKTWFLAIRNPGQTIAEILLAYAFMGFLLGMRFILDRRAFAAYQIPRVRPQDVLSVNGTGNIIYYYPGTTCATTIVNTAISDLQVVWPTFPGSPQVMSDPSLASVSNSTLSTIYGFIYFTNLDSCTSPGTMPDEVKYTLRMQENGPFYYFPQYVKISENDYMWKRSPEDYCRDTSRFANYTNRFVGVQYAVDMSIIKYATGIAQNLSSNIYLNHFGCPAVNIDQLHSIYAFFIPIFFSVVYVVTFIINVGYIVEERENKTKEYLRIYGLRTWVNNLVWITRSMIIYTVLTSVVTGLSMIVFPSSGAQVNSTSKSLFNYTHWTLLWTILFVYSIQASAFSVLFGQFFKRPLLAKLIGFVVWVITFIDFYPGVPVAVRYVLCMFPNTGLMFCLQVLLQYERKNTASLGYDKLYSNLFPYPLYIGVCLLLMLVFSALYLLLAVYIERINPGEFGVALPWYYLFKKSYWKPHATATVQPFKADERSSSRNGDVGTDNHWIEMNPETNMKLPSLTISHLTKKFGKFKAVSDLSLNFYRGEVSSLLGHNGAGKTTTTFILVGMLEPTSGSVIVEGLDNRIHMQDVRKILGFCPQYDILYPELSVQEHLELFGRMRHMEPKILKESIGTILHLIGLVNDKQTLSKNLSGGMKRRLSIGISLIGDPKVVILDEPTSGIDPYNRRLVWSIIRKMKEAGKCIILTTHFLEEADVLSDRIAIMTSGRLQAYGTPDFLKNQIEYGYRLFIEKQEACPNEHIDRYIRQLVPDIVLERQSSSEMIYGIRRSDSSRIGELTRTLDEQSAQVGIESYGLSMTTIEEVFLKLIEEAEQEEEVEKQKGKIQKQIMSKQELADKVFGGEHERDSGARKFWLRIAALLIKRWHIFRRQIVFLLGFFLLPIIVECLLVSVLPTPRQVQTSIAQNERIKDAKVTFVPSMYNPQTIVTYSLNNANNVQTNLVNFLQGSNGATLDQISTDTVYSYVTDRYLASEDIFVNRYQMGFALYNDLTVGYPSLTINSYFSTVNYHAMATSVSVGSTSLFQFHANSAAKKITTTNQPILTTATAFTVGARFFDIVYCFDTIPLSLFNFLNSVLAALYVSILLAPIIQERVSQSKDLQLLTNLKKRSYWFANTIFDLILCLILCILLTCVIKIGAAANPNSEAEVRVYRGTEQGGYFLLMFIMYSLASLPFVYAFSFAPKSELIGFIAFFILNVVGLFFNMILDFIGVFSQAQALNATRATTLSNVMNYISLVLAIIFPTVNLKRALFNIRLKTNAECVSSLNSLFFTDYSADESWMAIRTPGLGTPFLVFIGQTIFWWIILMLIENNTNMKQGCRRCCKCDKELEQAEPKYTSPPPPPLTYQWDNIDLLSTTSTSSWDDSHLDEDVRHERRTILRESSAFSSAVILVRDLVQRFKKRKEKSLRSRIYTAVDHLNFRVTKRSCFGLLGANGAGKTTTFRMLINDLKPTSGEIIINGRNINRTNRDLEIGFCPQFDWLLGSLSVTEILTLFARLKGLKWAEIPEICSDMIDLFGLELYTKRRVEKLSGGNKRKVSAVIAFMANPALVFLDEPTTGLDAAAKRKIWNVIRAARDVGLTIILTSHSMEECEALCTKIGIMKLGQFMCLGSLQHLKNRFGNGYAVQVKLPLDNVARFTEELKLTLPGVQIEEQHNGVLYCTVPYSQSNTSNRPRSARFMSLAHIFEWFNRKREERAIESYSITQTTLEQIFVRVAGDEKDTDPDDGNDHHQT